MRHFIIVFVIMLAAGPVSGREITTFASAKIASAEVNRDVKGDFYCGCKIRWQGKKGIPDLAGCGYQIRKDARRAQRIEWEHVMPAWQFGHQRKCWQQGGRKGCRRDRAFRKIESDMHNLQPVVGEVNADRANFPYGQWSGAAGQYGHCPVKIDFAARRAQPPETARGVIARTYFYMRDRYHISLSRQQTQLFNAWHARYPVSQWECIRDSRIAKLQGNNNPYVQRACREKGSRLH